MNKSKWLAFITIVALSQGCAAVRQDASPDNIISRFAAAVEQKDVEGFKALFLNDEVTWLAVVSDKDLNGAYKGNPSKQKVNEHGLVNFIEMAASTEESTKVAFSDCQVMSDGDIAVANCMYSFHLGGKRTNDGREGFLFVKTEKGWKISGMVFSSRLPEGGS